MGLCGHPRGYQIRGRGGGGSAGYRQLWSRMRGKPTQAERSEATLKALVNDRADPTRVPAASHEARRFHAALDRYSPTPVRQLAQIADELDLAAVLLKDESQRLGLPAFKVLGAAWAIERALDDQPEGRTLVAASAGNHGRAVAHVAAARGLRCRIFLPARSLPARREAIASEGAEVIIVDGSYEDAVAAAELAAGEPATVLISDVGESPTARWAIDGYATLFEETAAQASYDVIIVPVGGGSLAAAAARHGAEVDCSVVGVEPAAAACLTAALVADRPTRIDAPGTIMAGLDTAEISSSAWSSLRAGVTGMVIVDDAAATAAVRELAQAGLAIGESGAAPLAGLRSLMVDPDCAELRGALALGPSSRVLLIATEGPTAAASV
jgi:diaminopropionate ammonia-lyase